MRRSVTLACLVLTALGAGAARAEAAAPSPPAHSPHPQVIESGTVLARLATYGDWAAWSRYDKANRAYQLVVREPAGNTRQLNVPESRAPFEIGLGPLPSGEVGAVLSRCASTGHNREPCALYELNIQSPVPDERRLAFPGANAGSATLPALWKNTVAFIRTRPHHPAQLVEWRIGARTVTPLKLPADKPGRGEAGCPHARSCKEAVVGQITALTLHGDQVAYVKTAFLGWSEDLRSELWFQTLGRPAQKVDRIDQGEASGTRTFLSPSLTATSLYAYRHFIEFGNVWVRYELRTHRTEQPEADLGDDGHEGLVSGASPLGNGLIWLRAPGENELAPPLFGVLERANHEVEAPIAGTEILTLPTVSWAPGCDSRYMVLHDHCAPRRGKRG